jgi:TetR/AcrR family transcriptional regulator, transcriptional repressor for nem operon
VARPKEFERETALNEAIRIFSDHGYEGTSTDVLLRAMGISRQSMYDTFGDKRRLYLEALQHYIADSVADQIGNLNSASSPLRGLEAALYAVASRPAPGAVPACLGVGAVCEFGRSDPEVAMLTDTAGRTLLSALERRITEAKAVGEIGADVDVRTAAHFIAATFSGIKVAARGGAAPEVLHGIARMAIRSLN